MRTRVQEWGNSLAVRIPEALANQASLEKDAEVELQMEEGRLVLRRAVTRYSLTDLLDGVTPENLHGEIDTGAPTGREEW